MGFLLQIIRNGVIERTLQLGPGQYTVGRELSQIILNHESISKRHAKLIVTRDSVTVADTGSLNGIFSQGQRIKQKTFHTDFELEIGPFILKGAVQKKALQFQQYRALMEKLASADMRVSLTASLILMVMFTFVLIYLPLYGAITSFQKDKSYARGIMLVKSLAEINSYFVETGKYDSIKVDLINGEEGVLYSYIVETSGKIIAPAENTGKLIEAPEAVTAMQQGRLEVGEGKQSETIFYQPIQHLNKVIGLAIVGFDGKRGARFVRTGISVYANLLLVILIALCLPIAVFLIRIFLKPLRELEEDVSIAMKEGRTQIIIHSPYKEINNLVNVFNRLLFINALNRQPVKMSESSNDNPAKKDSDRIQEVEKQHSGSVVLMDNKMHSPWCVIEKETHTISQFNQQYFDLFETGIRQGAHIIEAFSNSGILPIISQLIENPQDSHATSIFAGKKYTIKKANSTESKNGILLVFEELING